MGPAFGAVIGGIAGAAAGGISSYLLTKKNAKAYEGYAKDIRKAAEKYSGQNAYNAMQNAGMQEANIVNQRNLENQAAQAPSNMTNKAANAANLQGNYSQGYNLGAQNEKANLTAHYNADTAAAQQALNQANIDYKAGTAATQAAMNAAGGVASLYGQIKGYGTKTDEVKTDEVKADGSGSNTGSDERIKEYNNHSNLPKADVDDALRRIESINYKYKDGTGLDNEEHTGVTAQSVENTAFDGMVSENENGVKQLDKQMMLEAVLAGIASLRKELDELESNKGNKITSDERCKEAENAIEANPVQAAQQLPQGSPIQKEAIQAVDGGNDAEVNDKVIEDTINEWEDDETGAKLPEFVRQLDEDQIPVWHDQPAEWHKKDLGESDGGFEGYKGWLTRNRPNDDVDDNYVANYLNNMYRDGYKTLTDFFRHTDGSEVWPSTQSYRITDKLLYDLAKLKPEIEARNLAESYYSDERMKKPIAKTGRRINE